jgi:hypothetical protein
LERFYHNFSSPVFQMNWIHFLSHERLYFEQLVEVMPENAALPRKAFNRH